MNKINNNYRVKYGDAEHIMDVYLYELQGHKRQTLQLYNSTICSFLSSLISGSSEKRFIYCDEKSILNWMIIDAKNRKTKLAQNRCQVIYHYVEQLCSHGLIPDNPLQRIKPRYFRPTWNCIIKALQSSNPLKQLEKLRPPDPQPGPLFVHINKYIQLQQSLGKKYVKHYRVLCRLDTLLLTTGINKPAGLKAKHIHEWLGQMQCNKARQVNYAFVLKHFIDYLIGIGVIQTNPAISVIKGYGVVRKKKFIPFILTEDQVVSLLNEAKKLSPTRRFKLRAQACYTMLALLYSLGLRNSEVRNLRFCDVNMKKETLYIAETKFYKSRIVPFSSKVHQCLNTYMFARRKLFLPLRPDDPMFITYRRRPISQSTLLGLLRLLAKRVLPPNSRLPRIHDLRHTFAVHRLLKWYRDGSDVQSKLILLSTFMGHTEIRNTEVYLTITMDLLKEANMRFYQHCGRFTEKEANR